MSIKNNEVFILNGQIIDTCEVSSLIKNSGFLYGDGCFETMRAYKGHIFLYEEHITRLFSSLYFLKYENIDFSHLKNEITKSIKLLIETKNLREKDSLIKVIISRGEYKERLDFQTAGKIIYVIFVESFSSYLEEDYKKGIKLIISSIKREEKQNDIYRHKTLNYLESAFAKNEARARNAKEAIFVSDKKTVLEGAVSNIFLVSKETVYTPSLNFNILPGITRKKVLDLCLKNNIKAIEGRIIIDDLYKADEIFITNSLAEILPVNAIEKHEIKKLVPGRLTKKLSSFYKQEVKKLF